MGVTSRIDADRAEPFYEGYATGDRFSLEGIDDDIVADFAAIGITIESAKEGDEPIATDAIVHDAAQRAAVAATFLRLVGDADAELAAIRATMNTQVALVVTHYERQMEGAKRAREHFTRLVEHVATVAREAGDFGKKKSASTPFGEFGEKDHAASVELTDADALLAHLSVHAPDFVRVTAKLPLSQAREYLTEAELAPLKAEPIWGELKKTLRPDGELPPGVAAVAARRVAFAKPMRPFTGTFTGTFTGPQAGAQ